MLNNYVMKYPHLRGFFTDYGALNEIEKSTLIPR